MLFFQTLRQKASQVPFLEKFSETFITSLSRDEKFRLKYNLPDEEIILDDAPVDLSIRSEHLQENSDNNGHPKHGVVYVYAGRLFLTQHFLIFRDSLDHKTCTFTLNISTIKRVERARKTSLTFTLDITLYSGRHFLVQFIGARNKAEEFSITLKKQLKQNISKTKELNGFLEGSYSEYLIAKNVKKTPGLEPPSGGLGQMFKYPGDPVAQKEKAKLRLWFDYFKEHGTTFSIVRSPMFEKLVRVGVPNRLRGEIWELCTGSMYLRFAYKGEYEELLKANKDKHSHAIDEIEKDLCRSLPEYAAYQDEKGILRLRNVLVSYSWKNPDVGYCQAMNIVVAALLIFMTEEQAFWCLSKLCDCYIPGYYSKTMYGTLLDQRVFESFVETRMPVLWAHIVKNDIQISTVSLPWFLSLFFTSMSLPFAFRIMDLFFLNGPKALFQVALAILKINGEDLLEVDDDGMFIAILKNYFQTLDQSAHPDSSDIKYRQITKFQELLVVAFKEFDVITEELVHIEKSKHKRDIFQGIESFAKKTQLRNMPPVRHLTSENLSNIYDIYYQSIETHKISLGTGSSNMNFNTFCQFLGKICDWCKQIEDDDNNPSYHEQKDLFLKRLFNKWDLTSTGELTLNEVVSGLDKLVSNDLMECINTFFSLFDDGKKGEVQREQILQISEALLFLTEPWKTGRLADRITKLAIEGDIADSIAKRGELAFIDEIELPTDLVIDQEKYRQRQLERYLEAASNFLKRCFEYARPVESQESENLISFESDELEEQVTDEKDIKSVRANAALNPESPSVIDLPTFRMIILADETYELLFSDTLRKSIHVDQQVNPFDNKVRALRNVFDGLIADGRRVAYQVRRRVDSVTSKNNNHNTSNVTNTNDKQDDLDDFTNEQTEDHTDVLTTDLLDLGMEHTPVQQQRQRLELLNLSSPDLNSKDQNLIEFEA